MTYISNLKSKTYNQIEVIFLLQHSKSHTMYYYSITDK